MTENALSQLDDTIQFGRQVAVLLRDETFQRLLTEFENATIARWRAAESPSVRSDAWIEQHTIERLRQFMSALVERSALEQEAVKTAVKREQTKPETRDEKRLSVLS